MSVDILAQLDLDLIPQPQSIVPQAGVFRPGSAVRAVVEGESEEDHFTAQDLTASLQTELGLHVTVGRERASAIILRRRSGEELRPEGYQLMVTPEGVTIEGTDAAGVFWGTRTLLQAFRPGVEGFEIPCLTIQDWPALPYRAMHYDTKHHQDTYEYVQSFIRTLARYKVNMLVWEWEDKFAYERHPEIGAPGAFTKSEMQALTAYARQYHVQIVPLVQGLGHVSYLLKHPEHHHLRELPASAWEVCPRKEGSYQLLFDLWDEAMEATPGSEFCHLGSDETYELGQGVECKCAEEAAKIGKRGLMMQFVERCVQHIESRGRIAMSWGGNYRSGMEPQPPKGMVGMIHRAEGMKELQQAGYRGFVYAPNPGIEPLFLGHFPYVECSMWRDDPRRIREGTFFDTAESIARAAQTGACSGSITTSWDDSGLHNQAWMPRFICAAEYSWSAKDADVVRWFERYVREYFGRAARDMRELFQILQDSAVFYYDTFERRVWHWGDIGKMHVPDFPRDNLEYNPFWNRRYAQLLHRAEQERQHVARVLAIIDDNLSRDVKHREDFEVFHTCAELMRHNADLVLMLGELEEAITQAHRHHETDRAVAIKQLERAQRMIEAHLADRARVYDELVLMWEKTRLPKGMSTPEKHYVWAQDRARHFANRTPDMRYHILDEERLDLEGYLERLKVYIERYRELGDA